jgi:hypothetical protein
MDGSRSQGLKVSFGRCISVVSPHVTASLVPGSALALAAGTVSALTAVSAPARETRNINMRGIQRFIINPIQLHKKVKIHLL